MRKLISERKWKKITEAVDAKYMEPETVVDGEPCRKIAPENMERWMQEISETCDKYRVVGFRHAWERLKGRLGIRRLRHLKLGRIRCTGDHDDFTEFRIEKISWDVHWMTNLYLATIIRDYLKHFLDNTQAIGNCVIRDNLFGLSYEEASARSDLKQGFENQWKRKVQEVIDEFDELVRMERFGGGDEADPAEADRIREEHTKKAFSDLAYIFHDLEW